MLWGLALAGLLYLVGLTVWLGFKGISFPYQLDFGEGTMLHFAKEWYLGQPIYRTAEGYPYITANYAPLPYALARVLMPILGMTYTAGRVWTLLAVLALAAIIVAWVRRESGRWLPAVAAMLIFVGSPYVYHWTPLYRVDLIGLALTLGGLFAVALAVAPPVRVTTGSQRRWLLWLAVVLFVAGLYAKQSYLFAPAAALAYVFFFVDRWLAIKLAAAIALLGGSLFLLINAFTGGGFWYGLVASNVNPFVWSQFWVQQRDFFGTFAILGLLTAWYVVDKFLLDRTTPLREKTSPLDLYLPAALVSLWLAGKAGSWENYFFEALAAFALCSGLGLARLTRHGRLLYQVLAPLLLIAQVALMWHTPRVAERYLRLTLDSNEAMIPILASTPDPIISEDPGLLLTNGKVLDYWTFQNSQLARAGRWDQSWELGQLRGRHLSMVILERGTRLDVDHYQRFTREFLSELDRNYRHARTVGKYELYEPDPLQHERRVEFGDQLVLVGWSLHTPPDLRPGDTLTLTVVWQAQQALETDYTGFAHLIDESGQGWAGDDHQPYDGVYPTSAWGAGEMVRDTFTLTVPADAPPGLYPVEVGWYPSNPLKAGDPATQERLTTGEGNVFRVAVIPLNWDGSGPQSLEPVGARFGEAIALEGYDLEVEPGAARLTLRWSAAGYVDADYTVFVHLAASDQGGAAVAQGDAPPLDGRWPTSLWLPGTALDDVHTIPLPPELPAGTYDLLVGLYDPATGERLPLPDGSDAVRLTGIDLP
ncbi:hypothetical protein ACFLYD_01850 [Chloroflexota bacterium]